MSIRIGGARATGSMLGGFTPIATVDDFPPPNGSGVRMLPDGSSWLITTMVDLGTDRLECTGSVAFAGMSPETCGLTSDPGDDVPIISASGSLTLRDMAITVAADGLGVYVDGSTTANAACDWVGVNFLGAGRSIHFADVTNAIIVLGAWLGPDGILVEGDIDTLAVDESLFSVTTSGQKALSFVSGAVVNRRVRFESTAVIVGAGATGFDVAAVNVPASESFILDRINFAGGGTYTSGLTVLDDNVRWSECRGITNSTRLGEMFFNGNSDVTTISTIGTYVIVDGTTTAGSFNQRFDHTSGRLTYVSALAETFRISIVASMTCSNNRVVAVRARKNGSDIDARVSASTTNGSGRSENVVYEASVQLEEDDYIEVFIANTTHTNNITVTDLAVTIAALT